MSDAVIGNIIVNALYAAVVTDLDVVQRDVIQSGMLFHTACELELLVEGSEADISRETGRYDMVGGKALGYHDTPPFGGVA